jgi:hypothetical protein
VRPPSRDVAQPVAAAPPPSLCRPIWNVATTVDPQPKALGSTSVSCCPGARVNVSNEMRRETVSQSRAMRSDPSAVTTSAPLPQPTVSAPPATTSIASATGVP